MNPLFRLLLSTLLILTACANQDQIQSGAIQGERCGVVVRRQHREGSTALAGANLLRAEAHYRLQISGTMSVTVPSVWAFFSSTCTIVGAKSANSAASY